MISYEYMISLGLAYFFFHRPFFCRFYFPFLCLAFSFLWICFKSSTPSVTCSPFDMHFQSFHLPVSTPLLFSLHLFLLLYFFLKLFYQCSALASTPVLPLLLALTLPVLLFLPLPFVLVMSLSWCLPCFAPVFPHPYRYYWLFSLPLTCFLPFFT